jgi:hypothetical protein
VLAYAAGAVGIAHSVLSISRAPRPAAAEAGLWMASLAALLLVVQLVLGSRLREPAVAGRPRLRRAHLWLMVAVLGLVALHVLLDGALPRS